MTAVAGLAASPRPARAWPSLLGDTSEARATYLLALFVVLLFTGVWLKPLTGYTTVPMDSPLIRGIYYPGYLAGLAIAALGVRQTWRGVWRAPLLWALVVFAFASAHWSIDKSITERRALALALSTFAAAAIGARLDWRRLTTMLALAYALIGVGNFLAAALLPSFGRMQLDFPGVWSGLFIEKNGLGGFEAEAAVVCAAAALVDRPRRWAWVAAVGLAVFLLLESRSKTSLVAFMVGASALVFAAAVRRGPMLAVAASFLAVTAGGVLAALVALAPDVPLALLGKDATLTGRTRIWAAVLRQIHLRPNTGYGYGAIWSDTSGHGPVAWIITQIELRPTYAHNGWLDLWMALGIYAVWLCAAMLAVTWAVAIWATYRRRDAYLALPMVAMFTLNNLTESQLLAYNEIVWMLFVMVATRLAAPDALAHRGAIRMAPSSRMAAAFR
jgi:exopolysaccharide production protein ExoQ